MLLQHRRTFATLIHLFDVAVLCSATWIASTAAGGTLPSWSVLSTEWVAGALAWTGVSFRIGVYESRRSAKIRGEVWLILQAIVLATGAMALVRGWLAPGRMFDVPTALGITAGAMASARTVIRLVLRRLRRKGLNTRTVLLIGRGKTARTITQDLLSHTSYGIKVLGNLHFTGEENIALPSQIDDLGDTTGLPEILKAHAIDEVHLCPSDAVWTTEVKSVLRFCETVGVTCRVAPDFLGIPPGRTTVSWVGETPTYTIYSGFQNHRMLVIKRVIDVVGTGIGMVMLLPVFLAIAAAIKATSRGPVFFRQTRVGLNGRLFNMLKFRSMVQDAEARKDELKALNEVDGPVFKIKKDPRVTKIGRFLRKVQPRRTAATAERAQGRHEPGRTATADPVRGASGPLVAAPAAVGAAGLDLHLASVGTQRDRLRPLDGARSAVHRRLEPRHGHQDHGQDRRRGVQGRRRLSTGETAARQRLWQQRSPPVRSRHVPELARVVSDASARSASDHGALASVRLDHDRH